MHLDKRDFRDLLFKVGKRSLELAFPSSIYCICCGNLIDPSRIYALCDDCLQNLRWANERTCGKCGKALENERKNELCHDCQQNVHWFERGFTCMQYGTKEKEILHRFKFNGAAYMGSKLGKIMLDRILLEELKIDFVTAVPMHKKKQAKRGYNPAELMAKEVAKGLCVPYNGQVLKRNYYKAPMNKLDRNQRKLNLIDSYSASVLYDIHGKSILLIDDVYTTGSTADECSKALKEAGADNVFVLTLAAGVN
ncbi:ComF family protein [Clostridium aminobutyricum]|uniref:ComF family protein n=1 Tax=Clostridium aminobutyricum TaxID=33953 RepID=A0A939DAQ7_CLOAM|nr:ComF family protein [Clostridium aminobutyricum]MBN7773858.1 ComF family protein [Clostridium aminobutyricum]